MRALNAQSAVRRCAAHMSHARPPDAARRGGPPLGPRGRLASMTPSTKSCALSTSSLKHLDRRSAAP
eukprot:10430447-Heterocapsa_arctica.AAC.1